MTNNMCAEKNIVNKGIHERINWCDIYKGIVIILVVIGHCTTQFNHFIYQFHMAAFFFISGYTSQPKNKSLFDDIIKKFCRLMVPYYTINLVGIILFFFCDKLNILNKISGTVYPETFQAALHGLLSNKAVYCDWLGAMWFLPVLFWSSIIFTLIVKLCTKKISMVFISVLIFLISMSAVIQNKDCGNKDLVGLAQFFLVVGYVVRSIKPKFDSFRGNLIKACIIAVLLGSSLRLGLKFVVDWPSRQFNGVIDLFLPFGGIFLIITLSKLLSTSQHLEKFFAYIGQNSMSIMCFHFIGFKAAYLILIIIEKMNPTEFSRLTPGPGVRNLWWFITPISIFFSVVAWNLLCKSNIVRNLLGYGNPLKIKWIIKCKDIINKLSTNIKVFCLKWGNTIGTSRLKKLFIGIVTCTSLILLGTKLISYYGEISVIFPDVQNQIFYEDGWLPQSKTENYRWMNQKAKFSVLLIDQNHLEIKGFIPENIIGVSKCIINVNDREVFYADMTNNQAITIDIDISDFVKKYKLNKFEIEIDGQRIPNTSDSDQRVFNALINSMKIY
ncbi:MAG: acyltransferase family protein [Lachnospiraceae bacterium]|nr:acyltransferase family protein [Lachnospiraceae bacterium]